MRGVSQRGAPWSKIYVPGAIKDSEPRRGHPVFLALLDEMAATHAAKGGDYSKPEDILSNLRVCEQMGVPDWVGVMVRLSDKFERLKNLARKEQAGEGPSVTTEKMEDTLIDAASYCLLAIVLRREKAGGAK